MSQPEIYILAKAKSNLAAIIMSKYEILLFEVFVFEIAQ